MTFLIAVPTGIKFFNWIGTMWKGQLTFETPMLFSVGLPGHLPARWSVRCAAGQPAARLPRHRHLLRGRALPLRAVRHHRVRHLRGHLLLVPEDDRPAARRAAGQAALLADVHRLPHHVPGAALAGQRGHAAPLRRLPAHRRVHHAQHRSPRSARSSSASRRCRSSGTSSRAGATARSSPSTTRGATATRWSGPPAARRRGTTSPSCPGSVRSARRSSCTTRTWSSGCAPRRTSAAHTGRHRPPRLRQGLSTRRGRSASRRPARACSRGRRPRTSRRGSR